MKIVTLLSGGLDSATLLYHLIDHGNQVFPMSINYGQRHSKELFYARELANRVGRHHKVVDMQTLGQVLNNSCLTSATKDVPEGHYADETMKLTVVPNRNMIMLAIAAGYAMNIGAEHVAIANHAGDHAIYPDCRPEFIDAMQKPLAVAYYTPVEIIAPFTNMTKAQIVSEGHRVNLPFDYTWSCYNGDVLHCGRCGTCVERKEAFELAGIEDPTEYEGALSHG